MALTLRPATMDDAGTLYRWRRHDEDTSPWYRGSITLVADHTPWLKARINNPLVEIVIAESDGKVVGSCRVDSNGEVCVTVAPSERRKGYGTQILLAVMALSKVRLKASIDGQNRAAVALAEKALFHRMGDVRFYLWRP